MFDPDYHHMADACRFLFDAHVVWMNCPSCQSGQCKQCFNASDAEFDHAPADVRRIKSWHIRCICSALGHMQGMIEASGWPEQLPP